PGRRGPACARLDRPPPSVWTHLPRPPTTGSPSEHFPTHPSLPLTRRASMLAIIEGASRQISAATFRTPPHTVSHRVAVGGGRRGGWTSRGTALRSGYASDHPVGGQDPGQPTALALVRPAVPDDGGRGCRPRRGVTPGRRHGRPRLPRARRRVRNRSGRRRA